MARLLAIDDSLTIRKLIENVLGRGGHVLDLAQSGAEGITRAHQNPPDLVLLDYVLPDMKGLDVCASLQTHDALKDVPVVVMSAKGDTLRQLFKDVPSVVGFLHKPFTPPELQFAVSDVLARRAPADAPVVEAAPPVFTPVQKEAAARSLYAKLKDRFEQVPEWLKSLGAAAPAPFLARRILTPEVMEGLLGALRPVFEDALRAQAAHMPEALLEGHTSLVPLARLIAELSALHRTGRLVLEQPLRTTSLFFRRGALVLVTHDRADDYARPAPPEAALMQAAEERGLHGEQRRSGQPIVAGLVDAGLLGAEAARAMVQQQGRRALVEALGGGPGRFEWRDAERLPAYVETLGQPFSMEQMKLEQLRDVDDWTQVEQQVPALDVVFTRSENFSGRVVQLDLTENERRILTVVHHRHTARQIIERTGLPTFEVFHVLFRLAQIDLIRRVSPQVVAPEPEARAVLIVEPDVAGVQEPLARMLRERRRPIPLKPVAGSTPDEVVSEVSAERPRMLIVNDTAGIDLALTAQHVRARLEVSDTTLVAVQERESPESADALRAAGYDAVFVKPFLFSDLERHLGA